MSGEVTLRKIVHGAWMLGVVVVMAGCASTAGSKPTASVVAAPSTAAPSTATASTAAANLLGLLSLPSGASAWTDNTNAPMSLDAYIDDLYIPNAQANEKSLYSQRGFVSGAIEGWINPDNTQQSIAIARFASANGATSAFDDLSNSLRQKSAPSVAFTDSADGAVGSTDPQLDSDGNAFVDITARVGDYLIDVHEYTAATPNPAAAKALLLEQVKALKNGS